MKPIHLYNVLKKNDTLPCLSVKFNLAFNRYPLFIQKVHKRPEDSLCIHGSVAPFGWTFHLDQLLVHLLHAVLNHRFETGWWETQQSFKSFYYNVYILGCNKLEEVLAHTCWSCLFIEKVLRTEVFFVKPKCLAICCVFTKHGAQQELESVTVVIYQ